MLLRLCQLLAASTVFGSATYVWAGDDAQPAFRGSVYPTEYLEPYLSEPFIYSKSYSVVAAVQSPQSPQIPTEIDSEKFLPSGGERVADAIRAALANNPQVEIAQSRVDAAAADRFAALGGFLPDVEVSAAYADESLRSSSLQTLQDRDGTTFGVTAVQPVSQGLSAFNRFRGARASLSEADLSLASVRQQTALAAARVHSAVVLAREIVKHRVSNLSLLNRQYEIVRRRQEAGAQGRTGVEQASARRAQAQVALGEARSMLAESEAAYRRIVGHGAPAEIASDPYDSTKSPPTMLDAIAHAKQLNPSVNAAEAAVKAAKHSKSAAIGDFAPKVTLEGSYFQRFGADQTLTQEDEEYQLVARLRMPIFNQGRSIAGLRSARANVRQARANLDQTALNVDEVVTRSWRQLAQAEVKRVAARQGIEAAKQSVRGLQLEYEAGQRTVIDVLDGQRDLVQAEIALSQAEFDLRVSQYELTAATGTILQAFAADATTD